MGRNRGKRKTGAVTIRKFEGIAGTIALPLVVAAWADLLANGLAPLNQWPVHHTNNAFVAFIQDKPIGVITFEPQQWSKEFVICLGHVVPAHRRAGVYSRLWKAIVKEARRLKLPRIIGGTFMRNEAMRATAKRHGRIEEAVTLIFTVPKLRAPRSRRSRS